MTGNHRGLRYNVQRGSCAAAVVMLAATAGAGPVHADTQPTPAPSGTVLRLPVVPDRLDAASPGCTKGSHTVMKAVPWAQQQLGLGRLAQFTEGSGVTVGVVDTGVSASASALHGRVAGTHDALQDCVGHGTFVAGIVAAAPRAGSGFSGVAPAAKVFAARGTDAAGTARADLVAQGIRAAVNGGAEVVEVSAALTRTTPELTSAVHYAQQHDVLVVAPAVPDTQDTSAYGTAPPERFWPAAESGVLAVVDVDIDGHRPDAALVPARADLAAPGQGVTGVGPSGAGHYLASGASVAAGFVTGAAALVRAYQPELTAQQVAARLKATSYPADVPRLDVSGALTRVSATEQPVRGLQEPAIRLRPVADHSAAQGRALTLAGCGLLVALVLGAAGWLTRNFRRGGAE
ncbi:S8 family serine peptidase [Streptomyces sp. NBC_00365]|uniref:S8 family serine peptidase n=1 Tax=Streptomyces sp. NBC_00365 TaxID=2975726 RepID=UPI00224D51EA|nr:S8 family serine peptidase [Streptomyces sp. NBC_00365]MCX5096950.1 S8 family serine peptidase [Streptomyces sp. NBC_00365]